VADEHDPEQTREEPLITPSGEETLPPSHADTLDAPPGSLPTGPDDAVGSHATVLLSEETASGRDSAGDVPTRDESGGDDIDERLIEAAIRRGLLTAKQATRVLVSTSPVLQTMLDSGFLSEEQARELEEEVRHDFVPGYKLIGELGRGAMGVVYKGVQKSLDRTVAIKVVNPGQANDPQFLQRFQQEAKALARLNHPNIVQVYDHGEERGRVFIALEFVNGTDCSEVLQAKGPFDDRDALRVIRDAALGLSHAHAAGIIHRDIKPANLMLVQEGRDASSTGSAVKVTDLGLARLQGGAQPGAGQITTAGTVLGSPAYMAPEQTKGETADFRSDIYALGATLYHLVTGQAPFGEHSALKILSMKSTHQLPSPSDVVPGVGADLVRILDRMLAKPREARYQSYEELLSDVEAALRGDDPLTGPVPRTQSSLLPPEQLPSTRKHEPQPAPAAAQALTPPAPPARSGAAWVIAAVVVLGLAGLGLWSAGPSPVEAPTSPSPSPSVSAPSSPVAAAPSPLVALLEQLEGGEHAEVVAAGDTIADLVSGIALLPAGEQATLTFRLRKRVRAALKATQEVTRAELERAHAQGEYDELGRSTARLAALYASLEEELPSAFSGYVTLAEQALADGAGAREREVWAAARGEEDPLRVLELLQGFAERFPFSPQLADVEAKLSEAAEQAPRVSLVPSPAQATLTLDGQALGDGEWKGHLLLGEHALTASAEGHFELSTAIRVEGPGEHQVRLGPRPRRPLKRGINHRPVWRPSLSAPVTKYWTLESGQWSSVPQLSGLRGESPRPGAWGAAQRDASRELGQVSEGAAGWCLRWKLNPPQQGSAEVRLLASEDGRLLVAGVRAGEAYLGVRDGEQLTTCGTLAFDEAPGYYQLEWDGDVAVFFARDQRVGSYRPDWSPPTPGLLQVAVEGDEVVFRGLTLHALVPDRQ
jgi:serine/threonine-protein kinase